MIAAFDVCITHGQIVVFWKGEPVALAWTEAHGAQGFVWSPTNIGFGVPDHDGLSRIEVEQAAGGAFDASCLWAVQVPFDVPAKGLEIGSVFDARDVAVPRGRYNLILEAHDGASLGADYAYRLRLSFRAAADPGFAILKRGTELTTDEVLQTDAELI